MQTDVYYYRTLLTMSYIWETTFMSMRTVTTVGVIVWGVSLYRTAKFSLYMTTESVWQPTAPTWTS